eukprot:2594304-Rhodomonas_salina.1
MHLISPCSTGGACGGRALYPSRVCARGDGSDRRLPTPHSSDPDPGTNLRPYKRVLQGMLSCYEARTVHC